MKYSQKRALTLKLMTSLKDNGSWCGETHVQKAMYCMQIIMELPTDFEFVLYKHGPFSFDLSDEIGALRADELLDIKLNAYPYGPSLVVTEYGKALMDRFPKTIGENSDRINYIAEKLGLKGVASLERLTTALYVTSEMKLHGVEDRAEKIHELKPHVSKEAARIAVQEIDAIIEDSKEARLQ
ncbi:hypothetical protein [Desulfobacterium sp. N47]|uniref:Antitoxin SocA-like Panacea domain-containing protein n=1 Tax=uncultured Desulfobacterium sp. TaxID=201089 RepID=E1YMU9_9BACT|nr:hypothetical protein N47_O13120 [uncultured Desulfobacterium sp.]